MILKKLKSVFLSCDIFILLFEKKKKPRTQVHTPKHSFNLSLIKISKQFPHFISVHLLAVAVPKLLKACPVLTPASDSACFDLLTLKRSESWLYQGNIILLQLIY